MTPLPLDEYLLRELARRTERCLRLELECERLRQELAEERERRRLIMRPVPLARRMGGE